MIADDIYDFCQPVLDDKTLEEEDKIERLEEVLREKTALNGSSLENTILDALWRHRNASKPGAGEAPSRHTVIRKSSPAPWSTPRTTTPLTTPISCSTAPPPATPPPPGFPSRPSFSRQKSTAPSPFASPRPSPRLALAQASLQGSGLNPYDFPEAGSGFEVYRDYGSDNVDWLVGDDTASNASSTGTGQLSAAAPEWVPQPDMGPHDILRSVLGDKKTNEEIDEALINNAYDLGATIAQLSGGLSSEQRATSDTNLQPSSILVGKPMNIEPTRPVTPNTGKSAIVCKYWLASGSCLRADCRFSHDATSHICKYWLAGGCLAGDSCQFSHDPSTLMSALSMNDNPGLYGSPPQFYQLQDHYDQFPALQRGSRSNSSTFSVPTNGQIPTFTPLSQQRTRAGLQYTGSHPSSRPTSRPTSRHQQRSDSQLSAPSVDDPEAFPTLASLNAKRSSKHHGQRSRHGPSNPGDSEVAGPLAGVVPISPSPALSQRKAEAMKKVRSTGLSESAAAHKIPQPQHIPWLETGARANKQYLKHRQEAIKHGGIRNKFLQSAAQAWNRNDARAAKALSLRGQAENEAMRKAHREAAKSLYEERNTHFTNSTTPRMEEEAEFYIDLHGLHPEEAIEYLEGVLATTMTSSSSLLASTTPAHGNAISKPFTPEVDNNTNPIVYAITGTGHHSKNGKDKVGKALRQWLTDTGYIYREFSVPGERGRYVGGVLGVDAASGSSAGSGAGTAGVS